MITSNIVEIILVGFAILYMGFMMFFGMNIMIHQLFSNDNKLSYIDLAIRSAIDFGKIIMWAILITTPFFIIIYFSKTL